MALEESGKGDTLVATVNHELKTGGIIIVVLSIFVTLVQLIISSMYRKMHLYLTSSEAYSEVIQTSKIVTFIQTC